jgi:alkyl hydroperoxide reductase subunit F
VVSMEFSFNLNTTNNNYKASEIKEDELYDIIIIGAGPAAMTAAVYCMRKGIKTAIVAKKIGGQVSDTKSIENYMGYNYIGGEELVKKFEDQVKQFEIAFKDNVLVEKITEDGKNKLIHLDNGTTIKSKAVIISAGNKWRQLNVEGEQESRGRGVSYCTICDGPFFRNLNVVVVGGGNSGVEAALDLIKVAKHVTIVEYMDKLNADKVLIDKLNEFDNFDTITSAKVTEIKGEDHVNKVVLEDTKTGEIKNFDTDGVFVEIGLVPNSNFVEGLVDLNKNGEIIVDAECKTNIDGIFAAGDITSVPYKQIIVAGGEGAKAALSACDYVLKY